jgi:hypothetical protein
MNGTTEVRPSDRSEFPIVMSMPPELVAAEPLPPDRHPVAVYLSRLGVSSRGIMQATFNDAASRSISTRLNVMRCSS